MPGKNSLKQYLENSYYHIYNRGVEKRIIFQDQQDYAVFLSYLKTYLLPKDEINLMNQLSDSIISSKERAHILKILRINNFYGEISLIAYCLMPNHFHLLVKQKSANSIDKFMNSLCTRYTMYFNNKNKRVGSLYQDVYKAVLIESDSQMLHTTKYIHRNPVDKLALKGDAFHAYIVKQPSSYPEYLNMRRTEWVHTEEVSKHFSITNPNLTYRSFVEEDFDISLITKVGIDI